MIASGTLSPDQDPPQADRPKVHHETDRLTGWRGKGIE